jgi:F-type H+-transporting ATPase subunit delta
MQNPRLAGRYAKSLMDIAVEQNSVEQLYTDAQSLSGMFSSSAELVSVVKSPIIKGDKKVAIFNALIGGKVNIVMEKFINLIIEKGREPFLPEIMTSFASLYKQRNNIMPVRLTTAHPLDEATKAALIEKITSQLGGAKVDLEVVVDEALVGGFVLEANNKLFDASVARDLRDIRKQFLQNIYIPNIR